MNHTALILPIKIAPSLHVTHWLYWTWNVRKEGDMKWVHACRSLFISRGWKKKQSHEYMLVTTLCSYILSLSFSPFGSFLSFKGREVMRSWKQRPEWFKYRQMDAKVNGSHQTRRGAGSRLPWNPQEECDLASILTSGQDQIQNCIAPERTSTKTPSMQQSAIAAA